MITETLTRRASTLTESLTRRSNTVADSLTLNSSIISDSFTTEFTISSGVVAPTAQPTSLTFSNVTSTTMDVSFTASVGGADGYVAFRRTGASPTFVPVDTTTYTVGNTYGDSTCRHFGAGVTFSETGLSASTTYYYDVFAWNGAVGTYTYLTTSPLEGSQLTLFSFGNALHFNGTNTVVTGNVNSVLNGSAYLCMELWFKNDTATFGANSRNIVGSSSAAANNGFLFQGMSGGTSVLMLVANGSVSYGSFSIPNITIWHHIRVVYDGSLSTNANRLKMWLDGVQQTLSFNLTIPATLGTSGVPIRFGRGSTVVNFFDGTIDNFCLWSDAVGSDTHNSGSGANPTATNLICHCKFDESNNSGTTADETGTNTFTLTNFTYDATSGFDAH